MHAGSAPSMCPPLFGVGGVRERGGMTMQCHYCYSRLIASMSRSTDSVFVAQLVQNRTAICPESIVAHIEKRNSSFSAAIWAGVRITNCWLVGLSTNMAMPLAANASLMRMACRTAWRAMVIYRLLLNSSRNWMPSSLPLASMPPCCLMYSGNACCNKWDW